MKTVTTLHGYEIQAQGKNQIQSKQNNINASSKEM